MGYLFQPQFHSPHFHAPHFRQIHLNQCYSTNNYLASVYFTLTSSFPEVLQISPVVGYAEMADRAVTYQDWNKLRQALELESGEDLAAWIGSDLFAPYFLELFESVIKPAQEEAATQGRQRSQGPKLRDVKRTLREGEKAGSRKFSRPKPNKRGWSIRDHYALCLHNLVEENTKNSEGIFYGKALDTAQRNGKIWGAIKRCEWDVSPSRRGTSRVAKILFRPDFPIPENNGDPMQTKQPEINTQQPSGTSANTDMESQSRQGPVHSEDDKSLTIMERIKAERKSETDVDLHERYWRMVVMREIAKSQGRCLEGYDSLGISYHDDRLTSATSFTWAKEIGDEVQREMQEYQYTPLTSEAVDAFDKQEQWLDNPDYQPGNFSGSCTLLNIRNPARPRVPGMSRNATLRTWQIVGIVGIIKIWARGIRGCILADSDVLEIPEQRFL